MCKKYVMLLPALLLALILPSLCFGQVGNWFRDRGNMQVAQLFGDVLLLQQLNTLALTPDQITATLALYKQYPPEVPEDQKALVDQLSDKRKRLLTGAPLPPAEVQETYQLFRTSMQRRGRDQGGQPQAQQPVQLGPLAQALWGVLTQTQKAAVLGDVRQAAANNQKFDQQAADRALKTIGKLKQADDQTWLASRNSLADSLSSAAGAVGTPQRDNSRRMFSDFLDRVRKLPPTEFASRQAELSAELAALMPPGSSLTVAMAEANPVGILGALGGTLLQPRAEQLLQELQAARPKAP